MDQETTTVIEIESQDQGGTAPDPAWPPTRDQAIAELIERDIARCGEDARELVTILRSRLCHALALNALAYYDQSAVDDRLAVEARRILRAQDRSAAQNGAKQ
jgi:hypothetical protein